MLYLKKAFLAAALSATLWDGALARGFNNGGSGQTSATNTGGSNTGASSDLQLNPANVQTGSDQDGQAAAGSEAGQVASATDPANFINFCTGKTLTNGSQVTGGSCNGVVMGDIPSTSNMVSTIITFPQPGQTIQANQDFSVTLQINGIQAGAFTNAKATYYSAPQSLNGQGQIIGHTHVTIQDIGSLNTPTPPDPTTFAFFKGIDDAGNGSGGLSATVSGGLAAGTYRVCTMSSSANHTPVLMPIAQRGAQDDCTKFTVSDNAGSAGGTSTNSGSTSGSGSSSGSGGSASSGSGSASTSSAAAAGASSSSTASSQAGSGFRSGHHHGGRFAARKFIA